MITAPEHALPHQEIAPVPDAPSATKPVVQVIQPRGRWTGIDGAELWRYRELLYFLVWRDIKIRYKQTALGAAWAVLQPFLTMVVFSLFFGRLAGLDHRTGGVPYPIYVYAGLLPWTFFANSLTNSGSSLINSTNLITKVYFPRLIIPLAAVGAGLVDLMISLFLLLGMMIYYHIAITWQLALVPAFLIGTILAAAGVGTLLSALTVAYRDFRYVVPFIVQLWMFITPVIYPPSIVPSRWRPILFLNPMTGLTEGFRGAFLSSELPWLDLGLSIIISAWLFLIGIVYFDRLERQFADII